MLSRRTLLKIASLSPLALLASCGSNKALGSVVCTDLAHHLFTPPEPIQPRAVTVRTSDFASLQHAIAALPSTGGVVGFDRTEKLYSTVDVPPGVEVVGMAATPGNNSTGNGGVQHLSQLHLLVGDGVGEGLVLHGASGVSNLFVHREGVVFGQPDPANFGGRAIRLAGEDCYVDGCFITGFAQGIEGDFVQRPVLSRNRIDCYNGIKLSQVFDIARLHSNHLWPFVTVATGTPESSKRGVAYHFLNGGDWNQLSNCFCFGYGTGFKLENVEHVTALQCGADGFSSNRYGTGFHITGTSKNIALLACQGAGQSIGFLTDTGPTDKPNQMVGCSHWGNGQDVVGWG